MSSACKYSSNISAGLTFRECFNLLVVVVMCLLPLETDGTDSHLCVQAIGNHEFDNGVEGLMTPFMKEVKFAVLGANIRPDDSLAATFGTSCLPYKIFTVGGEKVGVVGYTSQETPALSRPGESRFVLSVCQTGTVGTSCQR